MYRPGPALVYVLTSIVLILGFYTVAPALQWQDIASGLMSPACPGRTLINCTSGHAEQWRELIRQKLTQGESKAQIVQYFVTMRGEEVLAAPPMHGFALTAWLFPILIIINGAGLIIVLTYRWTRKHTPESPTETEPNSPIDQTATSDPYHARLQRELKDFSA